MARAQAAVDAARKRDGRDPLPEAAGAAGQQHPQHLDLDKLQQEAAQARPKLRTMNWIKGLKADNSELNLPPPQQQQQTIPKKKQGEKEVVRFKNGDIVNDDMLARDIAAGHDVEGPAVQEVEETDIADGVNRWDNSEKIPTWLKEYLVWHSAVTAHLVKPNWREQRYLVMTCLGAEVCGNVAHRLRPIMAMLRVAAATNRVFYIHWDKPNSLEKFYEPHTKGGINWIVPEFVMWKVRKSPYTNDMEVVEQQAHQEERRVVNVMYNNDDFAESYYDKLLQPGEATAMEALRDVWNVLFKPSVMLEERLHESLRLMGLHPGEYAVAHIDYELEPKNQIQEDFLKQLVQKAMDCMSTLRPGGPFLVAAQTYAIAREAIAYGKTKAGTKVHAKQIAHDTSLVPTDLFLSFVEIELMTHARCVAYNRGGYGQLGFLLGYEYDCKIKYTDIACTWTDNHNGEGALAN